MNINNLKFLCLFALKYYMTCECQNKGVLSDISLIVSFSLLLFLSALGEIKHPA